MIFNAIAKLNPDVSYMQLPSMTIIMCIDFFIGTLKSFMKRKIFHNKFYRSIVVIIWPDMNSSFFTLYVFTHLKMYQDICTAISRNVFFLQNIALLLEEGNTKMLYNDTSLKIIMISMVYIKYVLKRMNGGPHTCRLSRFPSLKTPKNRHVPISRFSGEK